jgi:hypothetical protein
MLPSFPDPELFFGLRDAQLMDLLEFGRMIHAEMSAIGTEPAPLFARR